MGKQKRSKRGKMGNIARDVLEDVGRESIDDKHGLIDPRTFPLGSSELFLNLY